MGKSPHVCHNLKPWPINGTVYTFYAARETQEGSSSSKTYSTVYWIKYKVPDVMHKTFPLAVLEDKSIAGVLCVSVYYILYITLQIRGYGCASANVQFRDVCSASNKYIRFAERVSRFRLVVSVIDIVYNTRIAHFVWCYWKVPLRIIPESICMSLFIRLCFPAQDQPQLKILIMLYSRCVWINTKPNQANRIKCAYTDDTRVHRHEHTTAPHNPLIDFTTSAQRMRSAPFACGGALSVVAVIS